MCFVFLFSCEQRKSPGTTLAPVINLRRRGGGGGGGAATAAAAAGGGATPGQNEGQVRFNQVTGKVLWKIYSIISSIQSQRADGLNHQLHNPVKSLNRWN
jgi:hypothetical protein